MPSKAAEQAARIAGVLTLWVDLDTMHVEAKAMGWGIDLAQFYLGEPHRLADHATVSVEVERAERLRPWLIEDWPKDTILPSEVLQRAPIRALRESPAARAALALLVQHGWLVRLEPGKMIDGAARTEAYRIVRPGDVV